MGFFQARVLKWVYMDQNKIQNRQNKIEKKWTKLMSWHYPTSALTIDCSSNIYISFSTLSSFFMCNIWWRHQAKQLDKLALPTVPPPCPPASPPPHDAAGSPSAGALGSSPALICSSVRSAVLKNVRNIVNKPNLFSMYLPEKCLW